VALARYRGIALVTDGDQLVGVFTAGDLTRLAERGLDYFGVPVAEVMTRQPRVTAPDEFGVGAVAVMERHGIVVLPVVEQGRLVGVVHLHDLMQAGAV
jgi:arabinose-5-phosphate isomerase